MQYLFKCPACGHEIKVDAESESEAVDKIMMEGKEHGEEVHPDMKTDPEEMKKMVEEQMEKVNI